MPWYVHEIVGALTGAAAVFFGVTLWIHVDNQRMRREAKKARPPAGTSTPEERSEEQPRPIYMDVPYRPLPPEDPSRPYIRLSYGDDDAPMGRF